MLLKCKSSDLLVCTILARTISKCMSYRRQMVMDKIISPTQSAFIRGRSIIDNVLIGQKVLHFMRTTPSHVTRWALKLDMSKAYHRVE